MKKLHNYLLNPRFSYYEVTIIYLLAELISTGLTAIINS